MAYNGVNRLGRVLQKRMKDVSNTPSVIELGRIRSDLALIPDGADLVIPASDYSVMVNHVQCNGSAYCNGHKNWKPENGDRVVIAWIDSEIIILGKIGG